MDRSQTTKQKLLLEYLISSTDVFALCKSILKPAYFNPEYRNAITFVLEYYDKYHTVPSPYQIEAETQTKLQHQILTRDQIKYCSDEVETFCKQRALEKAVVEASNLLGTDKQFTIDKIIKDAIAVSLTKDLGIDYFADPEARLEAAKQQAKRYSTGWKDVDDALSGGLAEREILLFSANSGGGKSITLSNLAVNMLQQGLDVLYISLELSEQLIAQRFDTMYTGVSSVAWQQNIGKIVNEVTAQGEKSGRLAIKHMPSGTNSNAIRSYLKEFELTKGYLPKLLIVDYLDIMGTNERVSADNVWEKDKRSTEQLRDILFDYEMMCATASQQNRSAIDAPELNQGHIAGGISKVNTVDWYVSIVLTPTMKAAGEIAFVFLKARSSDATGKTVYLKWDNNWLRIVNSDSKNEDMNDFVSQLKLKSDPKVNKKSLMDIMDI